MINLTVEGRKGNQRDPLRNFLFEVSIPEISSIVPDVSGEEPFIIRAQTASIPDRSNTPIESYFMGMTQFFPGRLTLGSILTVDFEETEDLFITKALNSWQNVIFNSNHNDADSGHSLKESKRNGQSTNIYIKMIKYNGDYCDKIIQCINAWPTSVPESPLDMSGNDIIRRSVSFQFDNWLLI